MKPPKPTSATAPSDDDTYQCPVCAIAMNDADICATDIEMGICHAACLEGSPVVDLNTGEPTDGKIDTFRYGDDIAEEVKA